jgi:hypothetical protein
MSIKDLFKEPQKLLNVKPEEIYKEVESSGFISEQKIEKDTFIPEVDFSDPKNFAKYGLAEEYYKAAISNVYNTYPYDGSQKEVYEWKNKLTHLDRYVFDNLYPKTTGYVTLNENVSGQYIKSLSGPNTGKGGNIYDPNNINRSSNYYIDPGIGATVELWFKRSSVHSGSTYSIFDLYNGQSRYLIKLDDLNSQFLVTFTDGFDGIVNHAITINNSVSDWHHYAFSVKNGSTGIIVEVYTDGILTSQQEVGTLISNFDNVGMIALIGANNNGLSGVENFLPASIDEFRFWKTAKTQKDIFRYRFDRVYGGTNTDISNTLLGVYYRFNEGITQNPSVDNIILDYSGRVTNGLLINYSADVRSTSSAIEESGFFDNLEPKDPIIYSFHEDVLTLYTTLTTLGSEWDDQNSHSIYKSFPKWIVTEDDNRESQDLKYLSQIIGSYFDKVFLEISAIPSTTFADYSGNDKKPFPFMNSILSSDGLEVPELFIESKIIEDFKNRGEDILFEEKINDLKNLIYKNLYNNLTYFYKSKGTEKAFRNIIRSFGIDDELIKFNLYANNTEFVLDDNRKHTTEKRKVINLSTPNTFESVIYNYSVNSTVDSSFLKSTIDGNKQVLPYYVIPLTFETELIFPKKSPEYSDSYFVPEEKEISLFGGYTVSNTGSQNDFTVDYSTGSYNFEVSFVKNNKHDKGGYFKFNSILTNEVLTSSYISEVYDDKKWNFAVRLVTPYGDLSTLTYDNLSLLSSSGDFNLELYAVNNIADTTSHEFTLTSAAVPFQNISKLHLSGKRFYIGAKRQNITGNLLNYTDVLVSSARFWYDYISDNEVKQHANDPLNFGLSNPLTKPYEIVGENIFRSDTLAFKWDFDKVTTTDGSGQVNLEDTKGSNSSGASLFTTNVGIQYPAKLNFALPNSKDIVKKYYHYSSKPQLPENIFSSDTISISGETDIAFTKDSLPINLFWSFEKSMYQTISEEILNMFAGILDFNNLIGNPINKFRVEYRELNTLREIFFNKVNNSPSLEKYIEYYKWIDSSIGSILSQFTPAGIDVSDNIRTMVESHALERSKHDWKMPIFSKIDISSGQIKGIKELKYDWKTGHAPQNFSELDQEANSLWLKERAERTTGEIFTGDDAQTAASKQLILERTLNDTNQKPAKVFDTKTNSLYNKTTYYDRRLGRIYDLAVNKEKVISSTIEPYSLNNNQQGKSTIQAPGREINNKSVVDLEGVLSQSIQVINIQGADIHYPLPIRSRYETIMVNRFSAPGNKDEQLDPYSESFNIYSSVNYRNLYVRGKVNQDSRSTASLDLDAPTTHKVNRNTLRTSVRSFNDNGFVTHQIPRSEFGYAWISASVESHTIDNGPYSSNYPNLDIGGLTNSGMPFRSGSETNDYVGLNTVTPKDINLDTSIIQPYSLSQSLNVNAILSSYNGLKIPSATVPANSIRKFSLETSRGNLIFNDNVSYREPPVEHNKPVQIKIKLTQKSQEPNIPDIEETLELKTDLSNEKSKVSNPNLKNSSGTQEGCTDKTGYGKLRNINLANINNPEQPKITQITQTEVVFPRKQLIGLKDVRTKPDYAEEIGYGDNGTHRNIATIRSFWRTDVKNRVRGYLPT